MSKKILSVLLAVVMIITASFGGMTVSAEGLTNYVGDGGFENADFSGTIPNYGTGSSTDMATWGRFSSGVTRMELVTSDNYSGDDSVALNGNKYMKSGVTADGAYIRGFGQRLELTAGDYLLTFIAKSDAGNLFSAGIYPTTEASIGVNKAIAYTYLDATNYWKEYTVEFTVSADDLYYLMIGGNVNGDNNIRLFYMDNVAVYAKSDIVTVNAVATAGGTVTGGGVVAKGDTVTLIATAKSGYEFTGWSDGEASASRTFTATADVSYTANFRKLSADYVPNGDFEADDWVLSDYWTTLSGNSAFLEAADPEDANNTVAYAKGATAATSMVSKNTITLKDGHTYNICFDFFMADAVSGNGTNFYRVGFLKPSSANLAGASFYGAFESIYGITTSTNRGTWYKGYGYKYTHSGADAEANIVIGLYNEECTSDFYVDNIVAYDEADLCTMTVTADKGGKIEGAKSTYFAGDVLTLTAIAKSGFEFAGWSDGETAATRTVTAENGVAYHANFTRKLTANLIIDGDFEADEWAVSEAWNTVNSNDKTFTKATESGNTYAVATPETKQSLASDIITVKPGETYTLTFDSMFIDSGKTLTGDMNGFYRYGFIEATQTALGGGAFTALAGNSYGSFSPGVMSDARFGVWEMVTKEYTNNTDADVSVKAVIGYYNEECGYEWRVDNVILYSGADVITIGAWAQNGSVSNGSVSALKGETVTITASPSAPDNKFLGWFVAGSTELVSTNETLTVTATENKTYYAQYAYVGKNLVVNGDFESTSNKEIDFAANLTTSSAPLENMWSKVGTGVNMFAQVDITDADDQYVNGNKYVKATVPAEGYVRSFGQYVTLEPNTDYVLEFIAKNTTDKDIYGALIKRFTSGSFGVHPAGGNANVIDSSAFVTVPASASDWAIYTVNFNSGNNTSVCVAFGSNITSTAGTYFAIDNVVLSKASDYGVGKTVVGGFENGTDGWTASEGATITTANTADTALGSFKKYLGNNIGVLNPAAEGDTFTSPAFATESGKTYDVVIYTRHNSADDARGAFSFTAGGVGEVMKQATYGKPANDSEIGKYENNDGFMVVPVNANKDNFVSSTFVKLIFTFTATANSHNITITTLTPVSAFIDGFEVYCHNDFVKLAEDSLGFKGTAIRITGVQGLRFKNTINVDALKNFGNYAKVVEYGTLAIKQEYKKGAITFENLTDGTYEYTKSGGTVGSYLKCGVAYNVETNTDTVFASNLYAKDFTGVLIGITEENYSANYVTRAYAKVQFADGSYTYVYGDEQVASITAVAQHIVDNNLESEAVREYLTTNILG